MSLVILRLSGLYAQGGDYTLQAIPQGFIPKSHYVAGPNSLSSTIVDYNSLQSMGKTPRTSSKDLLLGLEESRTGVHQWLSDPLTAPAIGRSDLRLFCSRNYAMLRPFPRAAWRGRTLLLATRQIRASGPFLHPSITPQINLARNLQSAPADRVPLRKQLKQEAKSLKAQKRQRKENEEASRQQWELTVGVEIHAQLDTAAKLFSRTAPDPNCSVSFFN